MDVLIKQAAEQVQKTIMEYTEQKKFNATVELTFYPVTQGAVIEVYIPTLPKKMQWRVRHKFNTIVTEVVKQITEGSLSVFHNVRTKITVGMTIGVSK